MYNRRSFTGLTVRQEGDVYWLEYGGSLGAEAFDSIEALSAKALPWISKELKRLSNRLDDLQALQNFLLGVK